MPVSQEVGALSELLGVLQRFAFPLVFAGSDFSGVPAPPSADLPRFLLQRTAVTQEYSAWQAQLQAARPHAGMLHLAQLQRGCPGMTVISTASDGLLLSCGLLQVAELYGSASRSRCLVCGPEKTCARGCVLRPDVVWEGEELHDVERARAWLARADCVVTLGWRASELPAGEWPAEAARRGAPRFDVSAREARLGAWTSLPG